MTNLEYLEEIKKDEDSWIKLKNLKIEYSGEREKCNSHRQTKALEIIAESLISIDNKLNSLINDGKVINVDTHEA